MSSSDGTGYGDVAATPQPTQPPDPPPEGAARVVDVCELDLVRPATFAGGFPHDAFDALRKQAPVAWHDEPAVQSGPGGLFGTGEAAPSPGFWVVSTHDLVTEVSKQPATFSSWLGGAQLNSVDEVLLSMFRQMILNMDPPEQSRLRRILQPIFTPRAVQRLRESIEVNAAEIAAQVGELGRCDLVPTAAAELPVRVLAELMGMPQEDRHLIVRWSDTILGAQEGHDGANLEAAAASLGELMAYGLSMAQDRRATPRDDMVSMIANAEVDGESLNDTELSMFWLLLVIAGNETTRNSVSGAVIALQEQGLWASLAAAPEALSTATDELIRFVSPVVQFRRTATTDVELGGQQIRAGDKVVVWYPSANRDDRVFDDPHALDLHRDPNPHVAFGVGPHFCLGSHLARLQASTLLRELTTRYPNLRIDGDPVRLPSNFIAGVVELPVDAGVS
jgi:cytochrome P450